MFLGGRKWEHWLEMGQVCNALIRKRRQEIKYNRDMKNKENKYMHVSFSHNVVLMEGKSLIFCLLYASSTGCETKLRTKSKTKKLQKH